MTENKETPRAEADNTERKNTAGQMKKLKRAENSVKDYQFFLLRLIVLMLVVWVFLFKIVGITHMPSEDMSPRLDSGDLLLYYRLDRDVKAQDVIVIEKSIPDHEDRQIFVSRVVATAGDTVEISDSERLIINGKPVLEPNIFFSTPRYEGFTEYPLTLEEGQCFVLADSREGGTDSRFFGAVEEDEILGTVISVLRRNNL